MADMDAIRQLVELADAQQHGTKEARLTAFRQQMEALLSPEICNQFGLQFGWDEYTDTPVAKFDLPTVEGWLRPGKDGHAGALDLMGKTALAYAGAKPFDTRQDFLLLFKGWL